MQPQQLRYCVRKSLEISFYFLIFPYFVILLLCVCVCVCVRLLLSSVGFLGGEDQWKCSCLTMQVPSGTWAAFFSSGNRYERRIECFQNNEKKKKKSWSASQTALKVAAIFPSGRKQLNCKIESRVAAVSRRHRIDGIIRLTGSNRSGPMALNRLRA